MPFRASGARARWGTGLLVLLASLGLSSALAASAATAADRLPDLGMARLKDFHIDTTTVPGHRLLRYTVGLVNVGSGPFELDGQRNNTGTSTMTASQRIFTDQGSSYLVATTAEMFYAGDGHNHWHVRDLEKADLRRLDNGTQVGTLAKHGFCFEDGAAYNLGLSAAPQNPVYFGCGTESSLSVTAGLSVGWVDWYPWNIGFQYIDITGLPSGHYRLAAQVNTSLGLRESNGSNDATWVDVGLTRNGQNVKVLRYGPSV